MGIKWDEATYERAASSIAGRQVTLSNMRVVAASLRRMAEEASGEERRALRGLMVRADDLRDEIERLTT